MIRRFLFYILFGGALMFCVVQKAQSALPSATMQIQSSSYVFTIDRQHYCEILTALPGATYNAAHCPHPKPKRKPRK